MRDIILSLAAVCLLFGGGIWIWANRANAKLLPVKLRSAENDMIFARDPDDISYRSMKLRGVQADLKWNRRNRWFAWPLLTVGVALLLHQMAISVLKFL